MLRFMQKPDMFCSAKQMTGFYMKRNTGLKRIKIETYQNIFP